MDYFAWPDYLIFVAFIVISLGIGIYHYLTGGRQKTTTSEFIMASRSLKVLPTTMSLIASFQSAVVILGMTAEMYSYGIQQLMMGIISFTLADIIVMQLLVPLMYPLKLISINEYFELRFKSKLVRVFASMLSILAGIMFTGTALFAPSAALQAATGIPIVLSMPLMSAVTIAYTSLGGMRAVIWTDVFQGVVMIGGMIAILIKGLVVVGGFSNVFKICAQSGRLNWVDWSPDPTVRHTVWGFLLGNSITWSKYYGLSQAGAQRYMATKTLSDAKLTVGLNVPLYWLTNCVACLTGLVTVAYYASIGCDPLVNGEIRNANQLLPHFVLKLFTDTPGFTGLFLAALYGGALSSVSSSLGGAAANGWEDIFQWKLKHWTDSRKVLFNRFLVVAIGIASCALSFLVSSVPGPIQQILFSLISTVSGPSAGMFLLGGLSRQANSKGALIGGITSLIGSLWLTFGSIMMKYRYPTLPPLSTEHCMAPYNVTFSNYNNTNSNYDEFPINTTMTYFPPVKNQTIETPLQGLNRLYSISYLWYSLLWMLVTFFVGTVASFLFRDRSLDEDVDEKLLIDFKGFFKWRNDSRSEFRTENISDDEIGEEATDDKEKPCLQPTASHTSSTTSIKGGKRAKQ